MQLIQFWQEVKMPLCRRFLALIKIFALTGTLFLMTGVPFAWSESAYIRVSQVGYERSAEPLRAYLMSRTPANGSHFKVFNSRGDAVYFGQVGAFLGLWSHNQKVAYRIYALEFKIPTGDRYH